MTVDDAVGSLNVHAVSLDPFYPLTILTNSAFPAILDEVFQTTFLALLLLFWLSVYHGVRQVRHSL